MASSYILSKLEAAPAETLTAVVDEIWRHYGYRTTKDAANDELGVDLIATRTHPYQRKEVLRIEHRHADEPIESSLIQQTSALRRQEQANDVVLVSTGEFATDAVSLADELDVSLVDGDSLLATIDAADVYPTLADYLDVTESVSFGLELESLVDRIIANTDIQSAEDVRDTLYDFFATHESDPSIDAQSTLQSWGVGHNVPDEGWEELTILQWRDPPDLDAIEMATYLFEHLPDTQQPSIELPVLAAAIELEIGEDAWKQPSEMSAAELADWCIDELADHHNPLLEDDPDRAQEIAERAIDSEDSVQTNKLRVAGRLHREYVESY